MMRRPPASIWILGAVLIAAPAPAADLVVEGCNELLPGEVGVREVVANVGDTVEVAITVNATDPIDAFQLELDVPPGLLAYVRTDPGDLTASFLLLEGRSLTAPDRVRIVGTDTAGGFPARSVGRVAVVVFQVIAPGTGSFGTSALQADLLGYVSCEDAHDTSNIPVTEWGRIKSLYRL
jgi:hypothetical protein